jgi:general secretion pathway protein A
MTSAETTVSDHAATRPAPAEVVFVEPEPAEIEIPPPLPKTPELSNPSTWAWDDDARAAATEAVAYRDLLEQWGVSYDPRENPSVCRFAEGHALRCLFSPPDTDDLARLNRPAVLSLFNPQGQTYHATLVALQDDLAEVKLAGRNHWVRLEDLRLWLDGEVTLLWRKPDGYTGVLEPGKTGSMVTWLDEQLAALQGRAPLAPPPVVYDESLVRQVRAFQSSRGLYPDGVLGPRTVIQINAATQADLPLLTRSGAQE